jgi:hypothetical protein
MAVSAFVIGVFVRVAARKRVGGVEAVTGYAIRIAFQRVRYRCGSRARTQEQNKEDRNNNQGQEREFWHYYSPFPALSGL